MSKLDEKIRLYTNFMTDKNLDFDAELLKTITKSLAPSIYKTDAETVSISDKNEIKTVKNNFLIKKLGLEDNKDLDDAIIEIIDKIGKSEKRKYRAVVYYLLTVKFGKQAIYGL